MSLICLSGIDGSGKTSVARFLVKSLLHEKTLRHVRLRFQFFFTYPVLALCRVLGLSVRTRHPRTGIPHTILFRKKNRALLFVFEQVYCLDFIAAVMLKVRLPMLLGYTIICDRYVIDALVDLMTYTGRIEVHRWALGRTLLSLCSLSELSVLLDLREEKALDRKADTESLQFLRIQRRYYRAFAQMLGLPVVDTDSDIATVHATIAHWLSKTNSMP